jgi:hypothetical protein
MMQNENAHEEMKEILRHAFSPIDVELQQDLWPATLRRLEERDRNAPVPWYDWALAGALAVTIAFFPSLFLMFAYHL